MITISFADQALHDICVDLSRAELVFGSLNAAALVTFISDTSAFDSVQELIDFLGDEIKIFEDDSLSVSIGSYYSALLVVVGKRFSRDAADRVIWSTVKRLKLVTITRVP